MCLDGGIAAAVVVRDGGGGGGDGLTIGVGNATQRLEEWILVLRERWRTEEAKGWIRRTGASKQGILAKRTRLAHASLVPQQAL